MKPREIGCISQRRLKLFNLSVLCCETPDDAMLLAKTAEAWIYGDHAEAPVPQAGTAVASDASNIQILAFGPTGKLEIPTEKVSLPGGRLDSRAQLAVWYAVAMMISATGHSPSSVSIAKATDLGAGTVLNSIGELTRKGYLKKTGARTTLALHVALWPKGVTPRETVGLERQFRDPNYVPPGTTVTGPETFTPLDDLADSRWEPKPKFVKAYESQTKIAPVIRQGDMSMEHLIAYLEDTGNTVDILPGAQFRLNGEVMPAMRFIAAANNIRIRAHLPAFVQEVNPRVAAPGSSMDYA